MEQEPGMMCLLPFIDLISYITKQTETFHLFPEETFHFYNLLYSTKCIYLHEIYSFCLVCLLSTSPKSTASASSNVVSVVAPKNRDVSSRSSSLSRTRVPL